MEKDLQQGWDRLSDKWNHLYQWTLLGDNLYWLLVVLAHLAIVCTLWTLINRYRWKKAYANVVKERDEYFKLSAKLTEEKQELEAKESAGGVPEEIDLNMNVTLDVSPDLEDLVKVVVKDITSVAGVIALMFTAKQGDPLSALFRPRDSRPATSPGAQGRVGAQGFQGFTPESPGDRVG